MSLAKVPGGPSPASVAETRKDAKQASGVSGKYAVVEGSDFTSNEFPYVPFAPDSYDDVADIKNTYANLRGPAGAAVNWVVPFTEEDANYVRRQRDQVENADFDRWVMRKFDLEDPAQLFLFQQIAPEQFQRRMDLIDYEQNLVTKYAKMRLLGPRSLDDLKFEWLVETKRIELPEGPIWDPRRWMQGQLQQADAYPELVNNLATATTRAAYGTANRTRFMAGLFSPIKYLQQNQVGWDPSANLSDIRGNSATTMSGQIFTGSNEPNNPYKRYGDNPIANATTADYDAAAAGGLFGRGTQARAQGGVGGALPRGRYLFHP